jgi:hypothetical protein
MVGRRFRQPRVGQVRDDTVQLANQPRAQRRVDPVREGVVSEPPLGEASTQLRECLLSLGVGRPDMSRTAWSGVVGSHIWIIGRGAPCHKAGCW